MDIFGMVVEGCDSDVLMCSFQQLALLRFFKAYLRNFEVGKLFGHICVDSPILLCRHQDMAISKLNQ